MKPNSMTGLFSQLTSVQKEQAPRFTVNHNFGPDEYKFLRENKMEETRPANCRFRLQDEGKPYPRSSCQACGKGIMSGLAKSCTENQVENTDIYGRVWMHCESGLSLTKASMARLMMFVLQNNIVIGHIYAFNPNYKGSVVIGTFKLKPEQFAAFEETTKGKLSTPAKIKLN